MTFIKTNAKKVLVAILALIVSLVLVACDSTKKEDELKLSQAVNSITMEKDLSYIGESVVLKNFTNKHDLEITWELENTDGTLKLEKIDEEKTKLVVTPTEYEEDESGKQINGWGKGTLKAIVKIGKRQTVRTWEVNVIPGIKLSTLKIAQVKTSANGTDVEFTGTVSYVMSNGAMVTDDTATIFVFLNATPAADVKVGAQVTVKGKKELYFTTPQVTGPQITVTAQAPEAGYDYSKVKEVTHEEVISKSKDDVTNYQKMYKITGKVIKDYTVNGAKVSDYAILDEINNKTLAIYNSSNQEAKTILEGKVGKYVSLVIITYDFHSTQLVWRNLAVASTIKDAEAPVISDEEIVNAVILQIDSLYKNKLVGLDMKLISEGQAGGTITWKSANTAIITNDGKLTYPTADTVVELTATIKSGDFEKEHTVNVTAKALTKKTVKEAIDLLDASDVDMLLLEGVIIGKDMDDYYYLADSTGVVFVRHKLSLDGLKVGDKVKVVGKGTVFLNTKDGKNGEYTRQISGNYAVEKVDNETHASPLTPQVVTINDFDNTIKENEVKTKVPQNELYGKVVTLELYVVVKGSFGNAYLATEPNAEAPALIIHHKSLNQNKLKEYEGLKIKLTVVVYNYSVADGWRLGFLDRDGDFEASLTNADKLAAAKAEIETIVSDDKEVKGDLDFITESKNTAVLEGAKYVWTTSDLDVISATGKFSAPSEDKTIKVTVKVYLSGNTEGDADATHEYNVVAKKAEEAKGNVMISQAYGGGGNKDATFKSDFIELYNPTDEDIDLTGWYIYYTSAGSSGEFTEEKDQYGNERKFALTGTIKAKSFFLIKAADGAGGTMDLPTPDNISAFAMGASGFKIALCNAEGAPKTSSDSNVVDFVGAGSANLFEGSGPTVAPSNTLAIVRKNLIDTNDNKNDFETAAPNPRNSSYKPS